MIGAWYAVLFILNQIILIFNKETQQERDMEAIGLFDLDVTKEPDCLEDQASTGFY